MAKHEITKKQHTILLLLYIFRFLNSKQIQEFLKHKDHRRSNSWLKDLVEKGFIERDFKLLYGLRTKPAVYHLSAKGRQYIKQSYTYSFPRYLKRISRDNKVSKGFKIKCQLVADFYLTQVSLSARHLEHSRTGIPIVDDIMTELTTEKQTDAVPLNTRQCFTPAHFPDFVLLDRIKPDMYVRRQLHEGIMHGLVFMIDAYVPRFLLKNTLKRIFDAISEEYWEEDSIHSLHIEIICPNNQIIIYIRKLLTQYVDSYYASVPLGVHLATRNEMYRKKDGKVEEISWRTVTSDDELR